MSGPLNDEESAKARSYAYHLLGKLFLEGLSEKTLEHVREIESLAATLDGFADGKSTGTSGTAVDLDEAAADYQHTFGFNVFPFQSTFLDKTARAGGRETERVTDFYREASFPVVETAESPDHIGVELNFLGFLSKLEHEADDEGAERARSYARRFLDEHLLRWLPALLLALRDHGQPFFTALAELTLETTLDQRRALQDASGRGAEEGTAAICPFELPEPPGLLDDPKTGLRDIAEYLLVPAHTGMFLSRDGIRALSRRENLPAGFGNRGIMMKNLLRSAADYDGLQEVTATLQEFVAENRRFWRGFSDGSSPRPQIARMWLDRLDRTEEVLGRIRRAHEQLAD